MAFGAGRGVDTVAVFAIGTGIGGGLVLNGQLHLGIGGTGGELGHMTIDFNGPRCGCGNFGCLEAYASGPAIAAMGLKAVTQGLTTCIADLCENDLNRITPEFIAQAAHAGDEIAKDIFERAGFYLGIAAANVCVAIGPRRIIIGGGVASGRRTSSGSHSPHAECPGLGDACGTGGGCFVPIGKQCRCHRCSPLGGKPLMISQVSTV